MVQQLAVCLCPQCMEPNGMYAPAEGQNCFYENENVRIQHPHSMGFHSRRGTDEGMYIYINTEKCGLDNNRSYEQQVWLTNCCSCNWVEIVSYTDGELSFWLGSFVSGRHTASAEWACGVVCQGDLWYGGVSIDLTITIFGAPCVSTGNSKLVCHYLVPLVALPSKEDYPSVANLWSALGCFWLCCNCEWWLPVWVFAVAVSGKPLPWNNLK